VGYSATPYLPDYQRFTKLTLYSRAPHLFLQNTPAFRLFVTFGPPLFVFYSKLFLYLYSKEIQKDPDNIHVTK